MDHTKSRSTNFKAKYIIKSIVEGEICFQTTTQAARHIALKKKKGFPYTIKSLNSSLNEEEIQPGSQQRRKVQEELFDWKNCFFAVAAFMIGLWFNKKRRKGTSLWVPPSAEDEYIQHHQDQHQQQKQQQQQKQIYLDETSRDNQSESPLSKKNIEENPFILHFCAHYNFVELFMEHLLSSLLQPEDVNTQDHAGRTPLHIAVALRRDVIIDKLMKTKAIDVNTKDANGDTPLMEACNNCCVEHVESLLKTGCNVSTSNHQGRTALHVAAQVDNYKATRLLIEYNSNVNKPDLKGRTALHVAILEDSEESAAILLEHGANISTKDLDGFSPLMLCDFKLNKRLKTLILEKESTSITKALQKSKAIKPRRLDTSSNNKLKIEVSHILAESCYQKKRNKKKTSRKRKSVTMETTPTPKLKAPKIPPPTSTSTINEIETEPESKLGKSRELSKLVYSFTKEKHHVYIKDCGDHQNPPEPYHDILPYFKDTYRHLRRPVQRTIL